MLYSTIVEKNESGLEQIIEAVEQFEEDRFLEGIRLKRFRSYDIQQADMRVREYQAKMNREVLALADFSDKFIREYATDNNQCFETAQRLFNRIRSTISASKRVFRLTCPLVRRKLPLGKERPSVVMRSVLSHGAYTPDLFGLGSFEESVQVLYEDLRTFFTTVVNTLALCQYMIKAEAAVRNDPGQCMAIFKESKEKALSSVRLMVQTFNGMPMPTMESSLMERKRKARSMKEFAQENYHRFNMDDFRKYLVMDVLKKGYDDGLTDEEAMLWPDDHEKALEVRRVVEHFDDYCSDGDKGKLDSLKIVEFIKWCGVDKSLEKQLYTNYFCSNYHGHLKLITWNAVWKQRKGCEDNRISDSELAGNFASCINGNRRASA